VLDSGALGLYRKLYYRELVARFGHHLALIWNLGEENRNTDTERKAFAQYIRAVDPYDHPITHHTMMGAAATSYTSSLGYPYFEATSIQGSATSYNHNAINLRLRSRDAGRPWAIYGDEQSPALKSDMSNVGHCERRRCGATSWVAAPAWSGTSCTRTASATCSPRT
jgi:hypothetical protein